MTHLEFPALKLLIAKRLILGLCIEKRLAT